MIDLDACMHCMAVLLHCECSTVIVAVSLQYRRSGFIPLRPCLHTSACMSLSCSGSSSAVSVPLADPLPLPAPSCSLDLESPESSAATVHNFEVKHA